YVPLVVKGTFAKHLIAFARSYKNEWIIAAIPLGLAAICKEPNQILDFDWKDTSIVLPKGAPSNWKNIFTKFNTAKDVLTDSLYVKSLFKKLPFAILKSYRVSRGAGLLLSISSLPSAFGIGDMGPEAYKFIDFLAETKQKYWQILPLNPTCKEQLHSSYSSQSSMAGNVFFISPESLLNAGLLSANDLNNYRRLATDKIDYDEAEQVKMQMLAVAYSNFMNGENRELMEDFVLFCKKEQEWLADYVVYLAIKEDQNQRPWDHWPKELRNKKTAALNEISLTYQGFIEEQKWRQFIFHRQWHKLKAYALQNGIQLIGDLPFYVAFDSADVWANQELFKLDENNNMLFSAGVPPDYFNADGQVWGMPVYNWDVHKAQHYRWWIKRMRRNLSLTDLLRLDHFRGFDTFWQIPAEEKTAINGTWEQAPGLELFKTIQENLGELPFIAEDLGELTQSLIDFRAQLALPGMKVLQFAFDEEMSANPHIPHQFESENFVVYSGTHDNNTSKGWFSEDLTSMGKERLSKYIGKKATISTIHKVIAMLAYQSIAKICILPMQDVLGLSSDSRLNTPASTTENWVWRLKADQINPKVKQWLLKLTEMYNRD
ncbi:MAG: 4-alpha-glucanotransferase, partial [Sphingobacteriales bacterium]